MTGVSWRTTRWGGGSAPLLKFWSFFIHLQKVERGNVQSFTDTGLCWLSPSVNTFTHTAVASKLLPKLSVVKDVVNVFCTEQPPFLQF